MGNEEMLEDATDMATTVAGYLQPIAAAASEFVCDLLGWNTYDDETDYTESGYTLEPKTPRQVRFASEAEEVEYQPKEAIYSNDDDGDDSDAQYVYVNSDGEEV